MSERFKYKRAFEVVDFKALDPKKGEFSALVSVFGNVDRGGDRVVKGAFAKSLTQWQEKGDPVPVIWNHMWDNPEAHIGEADPDDVIESDDGLLVKRATLDMDEPFARKVFRLLDRRRVKEFSFGYDLIDSERKDGALDLLEIELFEFGPTLKGMNPETELLAVKALAAATEPTGGVIRPNGPVVIGTGGPEIRWAPTGSTVTVPADLRSGEFVKAGARHSKETLAALSRIRDEVDQLIAAGSPVDEPPKSDEAEAMSKASDPDEDIRTRIHLLKEQLS